MLSAVAALSSGGERAFKVGGVTRRKSGRSGGTGGGKCNGDMENAR